MTDTLNQKDLFLSQRYADRLTSDRETVDLRIILGDLAIIEGQANLRQAILNRLLTRQGELAKLGHPDYGSRLYSLIGEPNNTRTQSLADLYIRECLQQEPRLEEITQLSFAPSSPGGDRSVLQITIAVKPLGQADNLTVNLSLNLGG
ncbi:GPW/gp25 family protein [Microcystis aeruginosa BLCCF158]|uniref:GPW/gp25 family protein n=1 Tax=Microcystis aeruginosa BLCC-F158 TaxID=2755316 RepID=A0A841V6D2_MICAE|nr:GPW/gp25 family protein [Microcystis aeruginosa]MBC1195766.1 GPW/gp25 family protein [Microcystis aeruginosa BLCC-F158]